MGRTDGAARRSGDPRQRAGHVAAGTGSARSRVVAASLAGATVVAVVGVVGLRGGAETDAGPAEEPGRDHATSACDLMAKAHEAAEVESDARYAAAVLLLDQAIVESARAARTNPGFGDLDGSMQALHSAAHTGERSQYDLAVADAQAACGSSVG